MKPIYPQKNNLPKRLILFLVLFLVLIGLSFFTNLGQRFAITLFRPVLGAKEATLGGLNTLSAYFRTKRQLAADNELLRLALAKTNAKLLLFDDLKRNNELLRATLGKKPETLALSIAQVLNRPNQSPYDTVIVDLGAENSEPPIKAGMPVIVEGEWLLGEIAAVYDQTALVALFSGAGRETPVTVAESGIPALATGRGGGNFLVGLPRSVDVVPGDTVKTVHNHRLWPLGIVAEAKSSPSDAFQTVTFKNPINIYELRQVEIVTQ